MVIFTKIRIKDSIKTKNPKIRKLIIESEDETEDSILETGGRTFIGKYLPITNRTEHRANIANFFPELIINATINHEHCNSAVGILNDNSNVILVFKKLEYSLDRCCRLSFHDIKNRIKQLVSGVKYLHSRRILHGDIKPSNILFDSSDNLKISDYGHSSLIISGDKSVFSSKCYTKNYRAPEVWKTTEWGFSADIWALGCTIYYMLYGKHLFPIQDSDDAYISCLSAWESRERNIIGESYELPAEWTKAEYFVINNLILRLCNPDESKRPSIFDISKQLDEEFNYTLPISCSPDSICKYIEIDKCDNIVTCSYDYSNFISPAKSIILTLLRDKSREYASLILMIYEIISFTPEFEHDVFNLSEIIASKLTRNVSNIPVTIKNVTKLKEYILKGMYEFFSWSRYYGI